ncbi:MAG TPA: ImmA/IrrE family metallo-endopeptidase [Verrucomicrobiae bacterium]|nr:ImmA/IrrE family metallo-endopeptidase [Verrucomicrobiae bacterium]
MKLPPLDSANEIDKIARNLLMVSGAWGKFPTPVDVLLNYAELQIEKGVDLSKIAPGFLTRNFHFLSRTLTKVLGMVDLRQKVVYLDQSQPESRKNFIKLHEVGHKALTWQSDLLGFMDDETTLDLETKDKFEREASRFASDALFQVEYFDDELKKLPLCIKSPQVLAKKFGGSNHAAIRRYVERSPVRCAVLVLHKPVMNGEYSAKIRDYFQSETFTADFGEIHWSSDHCGLDWPFVQEIKRNRRWHEDGSLALKLSCGELVTFRYHFFNNTYNTFVLILPQGEQIKSRITIVSR